MVDLDLSHRLEPVADLRLLAREGRLAAVARSATPAERLRLTGAAYTLSWPIVFNRLTRGYEQRRGHRACAVSVDRLADGCLDRFYDDVEAVVDDLLTHATTRIANAEGWITSRLRAVTIDAYRRRRGARGALQRPRLPRWLVQKLPDDAWHQRLAVEILIWVGVPATAGTQLWPLDSWAELRSTITGDYQSDTRLVHREVDRVLAAMRARPQWYADHVERPLGRKTPPLAPELVTRETVSPPQELVLAGSSDIAEARLTDLAALALTAIEQRLMTDHCDDQAIGRIIATVFGRLDTGGDFEQASDSLGSRAVDALVGDPRELDRIVKAVREIVG